MLTRAWLLIATICIITHIPAESTCEADRILHLPGQPNVKFHQFSGYISISEKYENSIFYYFVEAENDPTSKPLVLWLAGGPGCSSIGSGAFSAHGPFRPRGNILIQNEYSWNKEANMLYLESPAGVGFSYSLNKSFYTSINDEITARDNLIFLENWLDKFPEYKQRDIFIAGEGYAGHFVPQLARAVLGSELQANLKGIAIGNPSLDLNSDLNSRAEYFWSHGVISDSLYDQLTNICNVSTIHRQYFPTNSLTSVCSHVLERFSSEIGESFNYRGIIYDHCLSRVSSQPQYDHTGGKKIDVCLVQETVEYLNRLDVQKAMHAQLVGFSNWTICNAIIFNSSRGDEEMVMFDNLGSLVESGIRTMVYSGDQDSIVPLISTRKIVNTLAEAMQLSTTVPYRAWFESRQVGGWTQVYGDMLSFATIKGASSNIALTQPERSLILFASFLSGKPLPDSN